MDEGSEAEQDEVVVVKRGIPAVLQDRVNTDTLCMGDERTLLCLFKLLDLMHALLEVRLDLHVYLILFPL